MGLSRFLTNYTYLKKESKSIFPVVIGYAGVFRSYIWSYNWDKWAFLEWFYLTREIGSRIPYDALLIIIH